MQTPPMKRERTEPEPTELQVLLEPEQQEPEQREPQGQAQTEPIQRERMEPQVPTGQERMELTEPQRMMKPLRSERKKFPRKTRI